MSCKLLKCQLGEDPLLLLVKLRCAAEAVYVPLNDLQEVFTLKYCHTTDPLRGKFASWVSYCGSGGALGMALHAGGAAQLRADLELCWGQPGRRLRTMHSAGSLDFAPCSILIVLHLGSWLQKGLPRMMKQAAICKPVRTSETPLTQAHCGMHGSGCTCLVGAAG